MDGLAWHVLTPAWREGVGRGFGRLPQRTVPKARGSGLIAGQRGANQGPITLSSARPGLAGDILSGEAGRARLTAAVRFKGSSEVVCLCMEI